MPDDEITAMRAELAELRGVVFKVMDRLLDAVVPDPAVMAQVAQAQGQDEDGGAEEVAPVGDWTDPFIGLTVDRPANMVGRVEAGGSLPFVDQQAADQAVDAWRERGEGAFDEWAAETYLPDAGAEDFAPEPWVAPLDLGG